jgi:hypothetical protein
MSNTITYSAIFEKYFKRYSKKYRSLQADLQGLEQELIENPELGNSLGGNLYKIRLAVKSKNKGKSGGFRIITYLITEEIDKTEINLLIIYDKSDIPTITKQELLNLLPKLDEEK